jgi:lantibiotic modifying enzyme
MREVRILEEQIVQYQNELRTNIQQTQMREYVTIGNDLLRDFYRSWQEKFAEFEDESLEKIQLL